MKATLSKLEIGLKTTFLEFWSLENHQNCSFCLRSSAKSKFCAILKLEIAQKWIFAGSKLLKNRILTVLKEHKTQNFGQNSTILTVFSIKIANFWILNRCTNASKISARYIFILNLAQSVWKINSKMIFKVHINLKFQKCYSEF